MNLRPVSVHLIMDAQAVYNDYYHSIKNAMATQHGAVPTSAKKSDKESDGKQTSQVNFVVRMPEAQRHELFLQANQELLRNINREIERGATVYVANSSERQYRIQNVRHQIMFNTGCLFDDLQALVMRLRKDNKPDAAWLDALTMYDVVQNLPDGENYKNALGFIKQTDHQSDHKQTGLNNIFLHAHHHASLHSNALLELHCYVSTEAAFENLNDAIICNHALIPGQTTIIVHHYNGAILATRASLGSGELSSHYRHQAALLENPHHQPIKSPDDIFSAHMLDADNCVFNIFYFYLLTQLIEKYGERIAACKGQDLKSAEMSAFGKEMLAFVQAFPNEALFGGKVGVRSLIRLRDPLVKKFADLPLDNDIIEIRDEMLKDNPAVFDKNQHGPIFAQLVKYIDGITPDIMIHINYRTNDILFDKIVELSKSAQANRILLLIGSLRQSYKLDMMSTVWNGTSRFHPTLKNLVAFLNVKYADQGVSFLFDAVTTTDYHDNRLAGLHVATADCPSQRTIEIASDREKIRIAYVLTHYARGRYHVDDIHFYDDTLAIFQFIEKAFGRHDKHRLIPADMRLIMHGYDGDFKGNLNYIVGNGSLDQYPFDVLRYSSTTYKGLVSVLKGNLRDVHFARQDLMSSDIKRFIKLTRWKHPEIFFDLPREKTRYKIKRCIDVFLDELNLFTSCSTHVKNGIYAGKTALPHRDMTATISDIKKEKISLTDGLAKIISLAKDHHPIKASATKLLNLVRDGGHYEKSKMWFHKSI